jgi:ligand-binding sensor domain-containing protein
VRFHFVLVFAIFWLAFLTFSLKAQGQQYPFVQIPNAPTTCLFPFQDHRGALWLAGYETGDEGLYYFDGSRFLSPVANAVPKGLVRGIEEDSEDGIWLASSTGIYRVHNG